MRGTCRWCGSESARVEFDDTIGTCYVICPSCKSRGPEVRVPNPDDPSTIEAAKAQAWSNWVERGAHWPPDNRTSEAPPAAEHADKNGYVMVNVLDPVSEEMEWTRARWQTVAGNPDTFPVWRAWPGRDEQPRFGQEQPGFGAQQGR